ncbi:MAG: M23 family metallopeptidase [Pseudomonadota bacterium]
MTKTQRQLLLAKARLLGLMVAVAALSACASAPKGSFVKPIDGGVITSTYGPRGGGHHYGVDFGAKRGTLVRAAQSGKVTFRGRRKGYGRLIIIDHGGGMETYYAHLSRYKVGKGKKVRRGMAIGKVGSSGRSTGPHLHFELRVNGRPVNPSGVVPLR